jgi:arsenate reductase-like glutaredoxin family protein
VHKGETVRMNESSHSAVLGHPNTPPSKSRVKEIISTTQITFDKLKKDLNDRETVIEEKNREILKLKIASDELAQKLTNMNGRAF